MAKKSKEFELIKSTEVGADLILQRLTNPPRLALLIVEAGGGKTYMAIHAIAKVIPNAHILMVGPLIKKIDHDWDRSIKSYNKVMHTDLLIDVHNYEELQKKSFMRKIHNKIQKDARPWVLVVDEAQHIKSIGVRFRRIKSIRELSNIKATICLSATPITNSYIDSIGFLVLAGFYRTKSQFYKHQVKYWNDYHQPIVTDWNGKVRRDYFKYPQLIDQMLNTFAINIDVQSLKPEVVEHFQHLQLNATERQGYKRLLKLKREHWFDNPQQAIKTLREYLSEQVTQKDIFLEYILNHPIWTKPILLFYKYNSVLYHLRDFFEKYHPDINIVEVNGHVSRKKKNVDEPSDPHTVFLIQYVSGSEGFNAPWSNLSIFYEPTPSYNELHQAESRNVRAFQKGPVYHVKMCLDKTLDQHIWDLAQYKRDFARPLLDQFIEYVIQKDEMDN